MGSKIEDLNSTFKVAANTLQECTSYTIMHSVDPIPLCWQKAIAQLLKEKDSFNDNEVVAIIRHFTRDISIADSYLAIDVESIRKLYLQAFLS
jgi:hypothetical protein